MKRFLPILVLVSVGLLGLDVIAGSPIRRIDFNNFTFRQFWGRRPIKLKNGKLEFDSEGCHTEYTLKGVTYVDLTGDQTEEALVHVQDFTACGSSGVSDYYYIYTAQDRRPRLLWRFGTGKRRSSGIEGFQIGWARARLRTIR